MFMKNIIKYLLFLLLFIFTHILYAREVTYEDNPNIDLKYFIENVLFNKIAPEAQWGIYIERLDNHKVIYEKDAHKLFHPASNRKIIVAALALEYLGADFSFETPIYLNGTIENQRLNGEIIVKASGDPTFHPIYDPRRSYNFPFNDWAKEIKNKGIQSVRGDIVIDVSVFAKNDNIPTGWCWEQLKDSYASPSSAFSLFENCVTIKYNSSDNIGEPVKYSLIPDISSFLLENNSKTISNAGFCNINIIKSPLDSKYIITGSMGNGVKPQTIRIPMTNPEIQVAEAFKSTLEKEGISILGKIKLLNDRKEIDYTKLTPVFIQKSPDLKRIIKQMLIESNNFFAEQIYKSISAQKEGVGSYERSRIFERRTWSRWGLPAREIVPSDGSGLSRFDLISPYFFSQLLKYIYEKKSVWEFENLLPTNGINGTMRGRISKQDYINKVKAKTGTVNRVSCLSGYLYTHNNIPVVFSIMINNTLGEMGGKMIFIQDKICERLIREMF